MEKLTHYMIAVSYIILSVLTGHENLGIPPFLFIFLAFIEILQGLHAPLSWTPWVIHSWIDRLAMSLSGLWLLILGALEIFMNTVPSVLLGIASMYIGTMVMLNRKWRTYDVN